VNSSSRTASGSKGWRAAARAGIRESDVILSVDNVEVTNAKQFETVMANLNKTKPVTSWFAKATAPVS
jgi:S1-C subfamily serine protease